MQKLVTLMEWADNQHNQPVTANAIQTRFGCSRATSFRWLALLRFRDGERAFFAKSGRYAPRDSASCVKSEALVATDPARIHGAG